MTSIYKELTDTLSISEGDNVYISSDITKLYYFCAKNRTEFNCDDLINELQNKITKNGTIVFPTFSFDFSNNGHYDIRDTKVLTGALSKTSLMRNDFERTKHPMHSFSVWGKNKEYLCSMNYNNSFGEDSIFSFFKEENFKQIIIGTDYNHGFTFVHYVENACKVPYRFNKEFNGTYTDMEGNINNYTCVYPARHLEISPIETFNKIGTVLENKGIAIKKEFHGIPIYSICLKQAYPIIKDDIINNKCSNIYDFNVDRNEVFKNWR